MNVRSLLGAYERYLTRGCCNGRSLSKGERTRQAIIEAAYKLFLSNGYHGTSMRQIANGAGIALGGLYNHFASKEELFDQIVLEKHPYRQILPILQATPGETVEEFIATACQTIIQELGGRPDFIKLIFIELIEFQGVHIPLLVQAVLPEIVPLLDRFQSKHGELRAIPAPVIIRAFFGLLFSYYLTEYLLGSTPPPVFKRLHTLTTLWIFSFMASSTDRSLRHRNHNENRILSIIRKEFIQLFRDTRMLAIILVMPLIQMFLLGYSAINDVRNVPLAVFDQSHSPEGRALLDAFRAADYFSIAYAVGSEDELQTLIEQGKAKVALVIPPDYATRLLEGSAQVAFILDGSDPTVASTALSAAQLIGQNHATQILSEKIARSGINLKVQLPVEVRTTVWYNPDMVSAYFMIPGVIGMILFAIAAILTATSVVRERERGTIEQLIVTPIRPWELIVGKLLPYVILTLFAALEVIAVGHWWFGVPVRGSLSLIILLSALFLMSGLGIGLFASTVANTQQEAILTVWLTLLPSIFLSGFFFPLNNMPKILQAISYFIPLRYYLNIIRVLLIKGVGIEIDLE